MENKKTPVAYELAERIKREILFSGDYKAEDHLPGEVALAERLGAGRSSVREALKLLAASGYVTIIPNRGAFAQVTSESELPGIGSGVLDLLGSDRVPVEEMLGVRGCIEPYAAGLCAEKVDSATLGRLHGIIDEFAVCTDLKRLSELDYEFHRLILEGSGNKLLGEMCRSVLRYFMIYSFNSNRRRNEMSTSDEHRAILRGIEARSPEEASAAMRLHIEIAKRRFYERQNSEPAGNNK